MNAVAKVVTMTVESADSGKITPDVPPEITPICYCKHCQKTLGRVKRKLFCGAACRQAYYRNKSKNVLENLKQ